MKLRTTRNELERNYCYIVRANARELQNLLRSFSARAYNAGRWGWNWDAYELEDSNGVNLCVCAGYRNLAGERVTCFEKYDELAAEIWDWSTHKTYEQRRTEHQLLLQKFATEAIAELRKKVSER